MNAVVFLALFCCAASAQYASYTMHGTEVLVRLHSEEVAARPLTP